MEESHRLNGVDIVNDVMAGASLHTAANARNFATFPGRSGGPMYSLYNHEENIKPEGNYFSSCMGLYFRQEERSRSQSQSMSWPLLPVRP